MVLVWLGAGLPLLPNLYLGNIWLHANEWGLQELRVSRRDAGILISLKVKHMANTRVFFGGLRN